MYVYTVYMQISNVYHSGAQFVCFGKYGHIVGAKHLPAPLSRETSDVEPEFFAVLSFAKQVYADQNTKVHRKRVWCAYLQKIRSTV